MFFGELRPYLVDSDAGNEGHEDIGRPVRIYRAQRLWCWDFRNVLRKVLHAGILCVVVEVGDDLDDDACSAFNDCMAAACFGLPDNLAGLDDIAEVG